MITQDELQARMDEIFDQIQQSGEEIIVTDQNCPVLRILPIRPAPAKRPVEEVFADWRGKVVFHEEPNTPTIDE